MAVTKQTYAIGPTWSSAQMASLFEQAFIDAGLMGGWYDSFALSGREYRVLRITHDASATYGSSHYAFVFPAGNAPGVWLCSGWNASTHKPSGSPFLDFHLGPEAVSNGYINYTCSALNAANASWQLATSTELRLHRYTSQLDGRQSWFVLQQGLTSSSPFSLLHPQLPLHPWLDLSLGLISGFASLRCWTSHAAAYISFCSEESIRRELLSGQALHGTVDQSYANGKFHGLGISSHCYAATGRVSNNAGHNLSGGISGSNVLAKTLLPIGYPPANPAYASALSPLCSQLPWSAYSPALLAADLALYMHYSDNTLVFEDRFVLEPGVQEWEVIACANNATLNFGASASVLARVV